MTDTKLRELERRWKETGAVEDEAAYLLERVRVGDLTQERLELAAYCGHEGALKCLGWGPNVVSATRSLDRALEMGKRVATQWLLEVPGRLLRRRNSLIQTRSGAFARQRIGWPTRRSRIEPLPLLPLIEQ